MFLIVLVVMKLFRYTSNGEGVWSAGKRLLPDDLVGEAFEQRRWLPKPSLPEGEYVFYLTLKGKSRYDETLLNVHKKYLADIVCESLEVPDETSFVYVDEWQVVMKVK